MGNNVCKYTPLQDDVRLIMLAIDGGGPKVMSLLDLVETFVDVRRRVVRRRTAFELRKADARYHLLEGRRIALDSRSRAARGSPAPSDGERRRRSGGDCALN